MRLMVLEGDGIGPEIVAATLRVLAAVGERFGIDLAFEHHLIGLAALAAHGSTFPGHIIGAVANFDGIVLGPVDHQRYPTPELGGLNPSGQLRKQLDLYANIRPARTLPGLPPPCGRSFDLLIVRENTEGFYADRSMFVGSGEFMPTPDVALSLRKITRDGSTRIARSAFELAGRRARRKVTAVHKANVLRVTDGLFLECVREVAEEYPEVEYEEQLVDAMTALLVRDPSRFDVIVTTNMFGDILSDLASELSGSLGLAASLNSGREFAIAQAQHGSAPDIAGEGVANPASLIGSAGMLLAWIGERREDQRLIDAGAAISRAIADVLRLPQHRTRDLGGDVGTAAFADLVADALRSDASKGEDVA
ncbi:MAG: isocitrate/isopropylmalate dehydrogenase family protein [Actinomycetota bacterium]|nr:isocitrate/isopropylmalate dehydrogenase family protein [Actinomycetota bacterium]